MLTYSYKQMKYEIHDRMINGVQREEFGTAGQLHAIRQVAF